MSDNARPANPLRQKRFIGEWWGWTFIFFSTLSSTALYGQGHSSHERLFTLLMLAGTALSIAVIASHFVSLCRARTATTGSRVEATMLKSRRTRFGYERYTGPVWIWVVNFVITLVTNFMRGWDTSPGEIAWTVFFTLAALCSMMIVVYQLRYQTRHPDTRGRRGNQPGSRRRRKRQT